MSRSCASLSSRAAVLAVACVLGPAPPATASTTIRFGESAASVTPLRTRKSVSGHWCRRYELVIAAPGEAPERSRATRCRQHGVWKPVGEE